MRPATPQRGRALAQVCERRSGEWQQADAKVGALVRAANRDQFPAYGHCYASVDLDGDGTPEILARGEVFDNAVDIGAYCPLAGCDLQVFSLRDGRWSRIEDGVTNVPSGDGIEVSAPDKSGQRKLFGYYFDRAAGRFTSRRPAASPAASIATAPMPTLAPAIPVETVEDQAQAVVTALTLECVPANAKRLSDFQDSRAYEVKCGNGFGYLLFKFAQEPVYRAMSCAAARAQPNGLRCVLMRDEDVFEGVKRAAAAQDPKCVQTRIAWAGSTADQSREQYRVSCRGFLHSDVVVLWQNYRGTPSPLPRPRPAAPPTSPVQPARAGPDAGRSVGSSNGRTGTPRFRFDELAGEEPTRETSSCHMADAMSTYLAGSVQQTHCAPVKKKKGR